MSSCIYLSFQKSQITSCNYGLEHGVNINYNWESHTVTLIRHGHDSFVVFGGRTWGWNVKVRPRPQFYFQLKSKAEDLSLLATIMLTVKCGFIRWLWLTSHSTSHLTRYIYITWLTFKVNIFTFYNFVETFWGEPYHSSTWQSHESVSTCCLWVQTYAHYKQFALGIFNLTQTSSHKEINCFFLLLLHLLQLLLFIVR